MLKVLRSWLQPPLFCVLIILSIAYLPKLFSYQLSGDDLYLIASAPWDVTSKIQRFFNFSGQYRPLTHNGFALYRALLPHQFGVLAVHILLQFAVVGLWFTQLRRFISPWLSAFVTVVTFLSPIFYYHFYSISSLNNSLMLIWGLLLLWLVRFPNARNFSRKTTTVLAMGFSLLFLSMVTKESFLLNAFLLLIIIWQCAEKKLRWILLCLSFALVGGYFFLHFSLYESTGDYAVTLSLPVVLKSALDIVAWHLGYPRGWQYGAPEPKTWLTYFTFLITTIGLSLTFISSHLARRWKEQVLFILALGASVAPFFIIDRVLPFYFDGTFLLVIFWFVYNHFPVKKMETFWMFVLLGGGLILQYFIYFPQWHRYSFVGNANETIHNYEQTLKDSRYQEFTRLCIVNHARGQWATMDGRAAQMLYGYKGEVISENGEKIPSLCKGGDTLLLRNDGWDYQRLD